MCALIFASLRQPLLRPLPDLIVVFNEFLGRDDAIGVGRALEIRQEFRQDLVSGFDPSDVIRVLSDVVSSLQVI